MEKPKRKRKKKRHNWTRGIDVFEIFELFVKRFNFQLNAKQRFKIIKLKSNKRRNFAITFRFSPRVRLYLFSPHCTKRRGKNIKIICVSTVQLRELYIVAQLTYSI